MTSSRPGISHEGGQIQGRRQGRHQVGGEEQGRGEARQGQEGEGREGPQQAQEGSQRLLRFHVRSECPQDFFHAFFWGDFFGRWFDLVSVRDEFRKEFKEKNPKNKSVAAVGKAAGDRWKSLSDATKLPM